MNPTLCMRDTGLDAEPSRDVNETQVSMRRRSMVRPSTATKSRKDIIEWDPDCPGLGIRLRSKSGTGIWILQRRVHGRVRKCSLGPVDRISRAEALITARESMGNPMQGRSPSTVVLREFVPTFLADCRGRWRPSTADHVGRLFERHILPVLGDRRVIDLKRVDVLYWHDGLVAARDWSLSVLSSLMLHAEALGLRQPGTNPCTGMRRRKTAFKATYPDAGTYARLAKALKSARASHPIEVELISFLALTGARKGEALALRWEHLHGPRAVLPDSKTGPKTVWLPSAVRQFLNARKPAKPTGYVFGSGSPMPARQVDRTWNDVRTRAGCPRLRIHDLRHGFASTAVLLDADLRVIAQLLGHSDFNTTMGYAHLRQQHLAQAACRVSGRLIASLTTIPETPLPSSPDPLPEELRGAVMAYYADRDNDEPARAYSERVGIDFESFRKAMHVVRCETSSARLNGAAS